MDQDKIYNNMNNAMDSVVWLKENRKRARILAEVLQKWLAYGGKYPSGCCRCEIDRTIASVLRRTQ